MLPCCGPYLTSRLLLFFTIYICLANFVAPMPMSLSLSRLLLLPTDPSLWNGEKSVSYFKRVEWSFHFFELFYSYRKEDRIISISKEMEIKILLLAPWSWLYFLFFNLMDGIFPIKIIVDLNFSYFSRSFLLLILTKERSGQIIKKIFLKILLKAAHLTNCVL